jgi:hypothetical protein
MSAKLEYLFTRNDFFGWVPNVEGRVFFSNARVNDYGYTDNLISTFVNKESGHLSTRYIVASTRANLRDTPRPREEYSILCGDYRIIFIGTVNGPDEDAFNGKDFSVTKDLIGSILIIHNETNYIVSLEREIVKNLVELETLQKEYDSRKAAGAHWQDLEALIPRMKGNYDVILENFRELANVTDDSIEQEITANSKGDESEPFYRIYQSGVYIHRTGLTFLKDKTFLKYSGDIFGSQETDFRDRTFSPRMYKIIMNFLKQMFHENRNHSRKHDSLMGVTILKGQPKYEVLVHQLNYLKKDILRIKETGFVALDRLSGYMVYGKALTNIFKRHSLIDEKDFLYQTGALDNTIQTLEIQHQQQKSRLGALLEKQSLLSYLGFVVPLLIFVTGATAVYRAILQSQVTIEIYRYALLISIGFGTIMYIGYLFKRNGRKFGRWVVKPRHYLTSVIGWILKVITPERSYSIRTKKSKKRINGVIFSLQEFQLSLNTSNAKGWFLIFWLMVLFSLIFLIIYSIMH